MVLYWSPTTQMGTPIRPITQRPKAKTVNDACTTGARQVELSQLSPPVRIQNQSEVRIRSSSRPTADLVEVVDRAVKEIKKAKNDRTKVNAQHQQVLDAATDLYLHVGFSALAICFVELADTFAKYQAEQEDCDSEQGLTQATTCVEHEVKEETEAWQKGNERIEILEYNKNELPFANISDWEIGDDSSEFSDEDIVTDILESPEATIEEAEMAPRSQQDKAVNVKPGTQTAFEGLRERETSRSVTIDGDSVKDALERSTERKSSKSLTISGDSMTEEARQSPVGKRRGSSWSNVWRLRRRSTKDETGGNITVT